LTDDRSGKKEAEVFEQEIDQEQAETVAGGVESLMAILRLPYRNVGDHILTESKDRSINNKG
jgi:hypothetical protein